MRAPKPVTAVLAAFSETGTGKKENEKGKKKVKARGPRAKGQAKEAAVKVDVVADGGKRWIRVNT